MNSWRPLHSHFQCHVLCVPCVCVVCLRACWVSRVSCVTQGIFFTLVGNCNEAMTGPERLTKEELTDAFASHFEVLSIYETRCVRLLMPPPRPGTLAKRVT